MNRCPQFGYICCGVGGSESLLLFIGIDEHSSLRGFIVVRPYRHVLVDNGRHVLA